MGCDRVESINITVCAYRYRGIEVSIDISFYQYYRTLLFMQSTFLLSFVPILFLCLTEKGRKVLVTK